MDNAEAHSQHIISQESQPSAENQHPSIIRFLALFFSIIFHPLFIASYVIYFLLFMHPLVFAELDKQKKVFALINVILCTAFLPAFSVLLVWQLKLGTQSLQMKTQRERIIPYALAMIFYFWSWNVFRNLAYPPVSVHFLLGSFLVVFGGWFSNIYFKVSMHAMAVGGLAMFFILFSFSDGFSSGLYLSLSLLIAGIVCTSRLILSAHTFFEIYFGLFIGALAQIIAWQF